MNEAEMEACGYVRVYDYTSYSHDNHVNVIPEESFKRLVTDTFKVITDVLRETYGPYGSTIMISDQNETTTTKDGYNIFNAIGFSHQYKQKVYLAIKKIIDRVNHNVGDGTTSCILLAEKIFNKIMPLLQTPEDKRNIKKILNMIENNLQSVEDPSKRIIEPLTGTSLKNLLMLASNYDEDLVDTLIKALEPETDVDDIVVSMRNVIPDTSTTFETSANVSYDIDYLPGDYRCRVDMNTDIALILEDPQRMRVVVYDHTFTDTDWKYFMDKYDKDSPTLIVARAFSNQFLNNTYVMYAKKRSTANVGVSVYLAQMKGPYVQDELKDFAEVIGTKPRDVHALTVEHEELPVVMLQVYKYNCLCVHDVAVPNDHITNLQIEYEMEKSYVRKTLLKNRITALTFNQKDSIVSVKASTTLDLKMIADKIDDCVAIAKSAFDHGIVPNLLFYGCDRIDVMTAEMTEKFGKLGSCTIGAIEQSITDLFTDIYVSKHGPMEDISEADNEDMKKEKVEKAKVFSQLLIDFYSNQIGDSSYNIITDEMVRMESLPTSAQYDIEVLVASLSIVKYLLASRALIFDAFLLTPQGDQGHYVREDEM